MFTQKYRDGTKFNIKLADDIIVLENIAVISKFIYSFENYVIYIY
jgi:hypothetical protein